MDRAAIAAIAAIADTSSAAAPGVESSSAAPSAANPDATVGFPGPTTETATTCPYCGVGCGVLVCSEGEGDGRRIVAVRGDPAHPANFGRLCSKGATLDLTAAPLRQAQARVAWPMLRTDRTAARQRVGWDEALDHLATRFAETIERHGPDSVAFYISGQLLTEDYYVFNKLAKGLVGTNNIDTNSRLCMSSAVSGYKMTLGADAPPACYEDLDAAGCLFITGSNTAWAHPIVFRRIEAARAARPESRMIVVDPRRTETAAAADLHQPILPGTDIALYQAMLHWMLWEGRADHSFIEGHTEGFEALRSSIRECTPRWAAAVCGVDEAAIVQAADWFSAAPATLSLWCQGLNQSAQGSANNAALINLHLATGQIGRPGAGPFSLTGQPNAMGGREVGGMANLLSAHRDLDDPEHRAEVARLWGIDSVPARPGHTAVELFEAVGRGEVKAIWIACTNPLQSMPDLNRVRAALGNAELVVVQEAFAGTATAEAADVLLPATTWGEKAGTVTNSERRISRVRAVLPAFGEARDDWTIAAAFARRLAAELARRGLGDDRSALFDWPDPEAVWNEHRETTRGRDLDICGLDWGRLERDGPQQWPFPAGANEGTKRLYGDGQFPTPSGRARFVAVSYGRSAERVDARHPIALNTGRLRDQWHGMSRTGLLGQSFGHTPEPALQMAAVDMARRGLREGELARITSRRGAVVLPLQASTELRSGSAFVAMHWGSEFVTGQVDGVTAAGINALTIAATDPRSRQPELKHAAVRVEPAALDYRVLAFGCLPAATIVARRTWLAGWMRRFGYASCVPFGREREGLRVRLASATPFTEADLAELSAAFEVEGMRTLRYDDSRLRVSRRIALDDGRLGFVLLVGDDQSAGWLAQWMEAGAPIEAPGRLLLSGGVEAPGGAPVRGRIVCNCHDVSEHEIGAALAADADDDGNREAGDAGGNALARLQRLQQRLKCGTDCGSCLPELRRRISAQGVTTS